MPDTATPFTLHSFRHTLAVHSASTGDRCLAADRSTLSIQVHPHKTKIVATIGPASDSPEVLRALIKAGLGIARLNFSHGDPDYHAAVIARIRNAATETGRRVWT